MKKVYDTSLSSFVGFSSYISRCVSVDGSGDWFFFFDMVFVCVMVFFVLFFEL
jgi:hypothetical protein